MTSVAGGARLTRRPPTPAVPATAGDAMRSRPVWFPALGPMVRGSRAARLSSPVAAVPGPTQYGHVCAVSGNGPGERAEEGPQGTGFRRTGMVPRRVGRLPPSRHPAGPSGARIPWARETEGTVLPTTDSAGNDEDIQQGGPPRTAKTTMDTPRVVKAAGPSRRRCSSRAPSAGRFRRQGARGVALGPSLRRGTPSAGT